MKRGTQRETRDRLARDRRRRTWKKAVSALACVVVFCTTYALILPAITMERAPQCGKTEHIHGESCYTRPAQERRVLACTLEELGVHQHSESCRQGGELVCGYADFVLHRHDSACYDESGALWCPLPEIQAHSHGESCYAEREAAEEVHTHTDACYETVRGELTCAEPEGAGHIHSQEAGCYDESGALTCQSEETPGHQHTDACYAAARGELRCTLPTEPAEPAERELICGREETVPHTHDFDCYAGSGGPACGRLEVMAHQHTQACFQTVEEPGEAVLSCALEEHTHTEACFPAAETEPPAATDLPVETELPAEPQPTQAPVPAETPAPTAVPEETETPVSTSGACGTDTVWTLADGVLTISGTGGTDDYSEENPAPWQPLRDEIVRAEVAPGVTSVGSYAFSGCAGLKTARLPATVTDVAGTAFAGCNLRTLYWDAAAGAVGPESEVSWGRFQTEAGTSVERISTELVERLAALGCRSLVLPREHYMTLSALRAEFLDRPLTSLSEGLYYVDKHRALYRVEDGTASLAYCPKGLRTYTVPAGLPAAEGQPARPVTGVDSHALRLSAVAELTFEAPEQITELGEFAFTGAEQLAAVNGQTTEEAVLALLGAEDRTGTGLFNGTQITAVPATANTLQVLAAELELSLTPRPSDIRTPNKEGDTFLYYTGESATTTIGISCPTADIPEGTVVRVYIQMEEDGKISYTEGTYSIEVKTDEYIDMTVTKLAGESNSYCLELSKLTAGDTVSIDVTSSYPSPTTGGGTARIWGEIVDKTTAGAPEGPLTPPENACVLQWGTLPDKFPVSKALTSSSSLKLKGDGNGGVYLNGLSYVVKMARVEALAGRGSLGQDFMKSVEFTDTLTLPEGAQLNDEIREAIEKKTWKTTYENNPYKLKFYLPDGTVFLTSDDSMENVQFEWDETARALTIRWTRRNYLASSEIKNLSWRLALADNIVRLPTVDPNETYTVTNTVDAVQHFTYSADRTETAVCTGTVSPAEGKLTLTKAMEVEIANDDYGCMGEPARLIITAENPEVGPYSGLAALEDPLQNTMYLTAGQMAKAFQDPELKTITINSATLCTPVAPRTVTCIDGTTTGQTSQASTGAQTRYNGMTWTDPNTQQTYVTIALEQQADRTIQITASKSGAAGFSQTFSCTSAEADIQRVLDNLGVLVVKSTTYTLRWERKNADGSVPDLSGGETVQKIVDVTFKDTFQLVSRDIEDHLPSSEKQRMKNTAYAYDTDGTKICESNQVTTNLYWDFWLEKSWSSGGAAIERDTPLKQGDVVDYTVKVWNYTEYVRSGLLVPLVDRMTGGQALLVPAAKNAGAEWTDSATLIAKDGQQYYLLTQPRTYTHVWTSETQMADRVEVTKNGDGLETLIYWYLTQFPKAWYIENVAYRSMVCPRETVSGAGFSLGNECWLNDHPAHRLYDNVVTWSGSTLEFEKKIVEGVGDTGPGAIHSPVKEGQRVTYRLTVYGMKQEDGTYLPLTLTGDQIWDVLPETGGTFTWSAEDVQVAYGPGVTVTGENNWTVEAAEDPKRQQIVWGSDVTLSFTERADIYVTLTFPDGQTWESYAKACGSQKVTNTFFLLGGESSVTHELAIEGKVWLQKGVYGGAYVNQYQPYFSRNGQQSNRFYYNNRAGNNYLVLYYVILYNQGNTNLYLTDLQDRLPRGFTLEQDLKITLSGVGGQFYYSGHDINTSYSSKAVCVYEGSQYISSKIAYCTYTTRMEGDTQYLTIHFDKARYASEYDSVSYDEDRQMCYLKPGEYVAFIYPCNTNGAEATDAEARNVVAMPYFDATGGGVRAKDGSGITVMDAEEYLPNDGTCTVVDASDAHGLGFTGGTSGTKWLTSEVTMSRGGIGPGVTKKLASATANNGTVTEEPVSVKAEDTLNWTVRAYNDGELTMTDYVITDIMQAPYVFTGEVFYNVYRPKDNAMESMLSTRFFVESVQENSVTIKYNYDPYKHAYQQEQTLPLNQPFTLASSASGASHVCFQKDASGNLVMALKFDGQTYGVPAGGYGELNVSTKSPGEMANRQYRNTAYVTPYGSQTWATQGSTSKGTIDHDAPNPFGVTVNDASVRTQALATVAYGSATTAEKRVCEVGNETNSAGSVDERNFISLPAREAAFRYTLSVNNINPQPMGELVIIDRLPEAGDHLIFDTGIARDSAFPVNFAADPNFTVTVTTNGTETVLDPSKYTLDYSDLTTFRAEDWKGDGSGTGWSVDRGSHRTVRLTIRDESGASIPANSTVSLHFTCVAEAGDAEPGALAWNDFGYQYSMVGTTATLQAAPLPVGVRLPTVPRLAKRLVDHAGNPRTEAQDETFSFLLYKGEALEGSYETADALKAALTEQGKAYTEFTRTVPAGESVSAAELLPYGTNWTWTKGEPYTIVELPRTDGRFRFRSFGTGGGENSDTFTYDPTEDRIITCINTGEEWRIELTKLAPAADGTTGADIPLEGAVFALYSTALEDKLDSVPAEYAGLGIQVQLTADETIWYLKAVTKTDEAGKAAWTGLTREAYYLLEVKAPDGYKLPDQNAQVVKQADEAGGKVALAIYNHTGGMRLPETGGAGNNWYTIGGLLLAAGAASLLLYGRKRRGKGGVETF